MATAQFLKTSLFSDPSGATPSSCWHAVAKRLLQGASPGLESNTASTGADESLSSVDDQDSVQGVRKEDLPLAEECSPAFSVLAETEDCDLTAATMSDIGSHTYTSAKDASRDIVLEGGDGDPVVFWKVKEGSPAWTAGARAGDELVALNGLGVTMLITRPAADIFPLMQGEVSVHWRKNLKDPDAKVRWHKRRPRDWEELQDDGLWKPEQPVSRTTPLSRRLWRCGSCDCRNFTHQEHCRRCGLRDTRLPPRLSVLAYHPYDQSEAPLLYPSEGITDEEVREAALAGYVDA